MRDSHVEGAIRRILSRRQTGAPGNCPDANELAAFLESRLSPSEANRFEQHAADCAACREALALSLQMVEPEADSVRAPARLAQRSSYSTSPLRFALAAVVLLAVGVLLFKAVREDQFPQAGPQLAREERASAPKGGIPSKSEVQGKPTAYSPQPAAPLQMQAPTSAKEPPVIQIAASPRKEDAAPQKPAVPSAAPAAPSPVPAQLQPQARADALKQAGGEPGETLQKEKLAQLADKDVQQKSETAALVQAKQAGVGGRDLNKSAQTAQLNLQTAQAAPANVEVQAGNLAAANRTQLAFPEAQRLALQANDKSQVNRVQQALEQALAFRRKNPPPAVTTQVLSKDPKTRGERTFMRTADYWVDSQCVAHAGAPSREILRDSKEYLEILAKEPALAELRPAEIPILIYWDGANLLIR